ncbi:MULTISPECIES: SDR family oxidoreductase [Streptomyces]|uniref:Nucleoside-diphosphate sugar epimerase n=1 Tax=Streptomyces katrae TaxID=68223 RepID=A0A0F4IQL1_9ACTN|nr:SDR family oxidoreductase [Streptomyces katrae]KJY23783.1 nucleoside-diphosphate sugar epimerase [Streptomyces katrae]
MMLVTGATGTIGREVLRRLAPDVPVRVMARQPARVTGAPGKAETVRGDYDEPESLDRALRGVDSVFLVTSRIGRDDDARFLRAARAAGVRHVVKLSAAAVEDGRADDLITRWQRDNEDLLRGSGMEWTLLRPRSFMSNTLSWASSIRSDGVVRALYGKSANACVDPRDIAEVAVRALTEPGHAGRAYVLTGPAALTATEQTAQLSELLGRSLRCEELDPAEARSLWGTRYPEAVAEALLRSAERQRDGAKAGVRDTVEEVTGRPAGTFRAWAAGHLTAFMPHRSAVGQPE